ncbi:NAD(P)/FAD-dependent oxidoreductase [Parabacteroides sp. OttesenSCG-928-N08]|nr:NAD(P)/FAD-dependent oxidoreductase [Parabacteroides sp. OttesenSCG-928-N08]
MNKHILIIGSGLGGLVCGYILSRNGYRVTLLEKNRQIGGCLQTFSRHGIKFETGMHYIGSLEEGQTLHKFFTYLSLFSDVSFRSLDERAYDIISIDGKQFPFAKGEEPFVEQLAQSFPHQREELKQYMRIIQQVANDSPLYSFRYSQSMALLNPQYVKSSVGDIIDSTVSDPLLRQVLAGNLPLYAGIKEKTPFYIHALITHFYNNSAYRIVGGSGEIARSLAKSIRDMGGAVYTNREVTKIHCDAQRAVSVETSDGERIEADYFFTNIHPMRTLELLDTRLIRSSYRERISGLQNTVSNFTVYIQFKKGTVPYLNSNLFHYNEPTVWGGEDYNDKNWPKSYLYMHLTPQNNDGYADAAILIGYMKFADVEQWAGTSIGKRGADYEEFKQRKAERMLQELEKLQPGIRSHILRYHTSSPLTYFDYTGTQEGSMYGILRDCTDPIRSIVSQRTKIPNLYQTGQNINTHGILGVIIGAIIASGELVGTETVMDQIIRAQ